MSTNSLNTLSWKCIRLAAHTFFQNIRYKQKVHFSKFFFHKKGILSKRSQQWKYIRKKAKEKLYSNKLNPKQVIYLGLTSIIYHYKHDTFFPVPAVQHIFKHKRRKSQENPYSLNENPLHGKRTRDNTFYNPHKIKRVLTIASGSMIRQRKHDGKAPTRGRIPKVHITQPFRHEGVKYEKHTTISTLHDGASSKS